MLRLRNVGVFDGRLRHNMTAGKVTGTYFLPWFLVSRSVISRAITATTRHKAAHLCGFFCAWCYARLTQERQAKKSPHKAGKITGFYRGFLHRDITQHL